MKYILNYKEFLEGNFFNNSKISIKNDQELGGLINNISNKKFNNDVKLLRNFTSKKYYNKSKIVLNISWYDSKDHSILYRIETRTNFKSISEFNLYIKNLLNKLIPDHIDNIKDEGKYHIYDRNMNLSIIIYISLNNNNNIDIISVINGFSDKNVLKTIYI